MGKILLVLDGHDGSGKTTLASRLAEAVGGVHIRPFAGAQGELMLEAAERSAHALAAELARALVERASSNDAPVLICDRHWMTVFTLLPESFWSAWEPLPPTTLCWADLDTTLARLAHRREAPQARAYHLGYLRRYWDLAQRFGCTVLRTDQLSVDACLEDLIAWARPLIASSAPGAR